MEKIEIKDILILMLVLAMLCINIIIYIYRFQPRDENKIIYEKDNSSKLLDSNASNKQEEMIQSMSERDRMEYYFSQFIGYIEDEEYQKAYDLLNDEFKNSYFKTLDEFKKYVDKTYPDFVSFSYNNIDRQGYIYVLTITVINPNVNKEESKKTQRIVIKENDFNDFVLSFQVI